MQVSAPDVAPVSTTRWTAARSALRLVSPEIAQINFVHGATDQTSAGLSEQMHADVGGTRQQRTHCLIQQAGSCGAGRAGPRCCEDSEDTHQHIVPGWGGARAVADHAAKDIAQSIRHIECGPDGVRHWRCAAPGTTGRGIRDKGEPTPHAGREPVRRLRPPPLGGPTVHHVTCATRPDAHEARPDTDAIAMAQTETAEIARCRSDPEREVRPVGCQQRPHFAIDREIDGMREGLLDDAATHGTDVERVANGDGLHRCHEAQARAAMALSAFDTQPKIPPWALIISSPTR